MISLIFKILADAAGFKRTLDKELPAASKAAGKKAGAEAGSEFGKQFGGQVRSALLSVVGAGAITAAIKGAIKNAATVQADAFKKGISVEAVQELRAASKWSGYSESELTDLAKTDPRKFQAIMGDPRSKRGVKSQEEIGSLGQANESMEEASAKASEGFAWLWNKAVDFGTHVGTRIDAAMTSTNPLATEEQKAVARLQMEQDFLDELNSSDRMKQTAAVIAESIAAPTVEQILRASGVVPGTRGYYNEQENKYLIQLHEDLMKIDNNLTKKL